MRAKLFIKAASGWGTRVGALVLLAACAIGVSEKQWQQAQEFERQGQYLRAIEEYSKIVNYGHRSPHATRAQLQIARLYETQLKDYSRAIRAYRDAFRRSEEERTKMDSRLAVARIYLESLQNPAAAAEEYGSLFKDYGKSHREGPEILLSYAKALMEAGSFSEGAARYHEFRTLFPGHREGPRTLVDEGQALLAERQPEKAVEVFREFIRLFSDKAGYESLTGEAYYGLGSAFENMDELTQALEAYKRGLATYPNPRVIEVKIQRVQKRKKDRKL